MKSDPSVAEKPVGMDYTIRLEEGPNDYLEAALSRAGTINISVGNDWAGDTETGFGREGSIMLSADQAQTLGTRLLDWAETVRRENGSPRQS